jgi:hypothetical protein
MVSKRLQKFRRAARQFGQGMTEYLVVVAVIVAGSVAVYSAFGNVIRGQMAIATNTLAGGTSEANATIREKVDKAKGIAIEAGQPAKTLSNFECEGSDC